MRTEETLELRWFFAVIRRWAWLIAGCTLLALISAFFITSRMPLVYEATTTLLMAPAEAVGASEYSSLMAGERLALTYGQMLKDRSTLQTVISRLGLEETPEALAKKIKIEVVENTQLVRITVRASSSAQAALIANAVADIFIDYAKALQEDRYRDLISSKETKIEAQSKVVGETQAQIETVGVRKVTNETELTQLQGLLADDRAADRALQQDLQSFQLLVEQMKDNVRIVEAARVPAAGTRVTNPYTATVTLLVDQVGVDLGADYAGVLASERLAGTYAQMMVGPSVLEAAIAQLGTGQNPDALAAKVKAQPIANTQLVRLQVAGVDAPRTVSLANAIAQVFVDQVQEMQVKPYLSRLADMQAEITRLSVRINDTQAEIQARTAAKLQHESELAQLQSLLAEYRSDYRALQQEYEQLLLAAIQASGTVVVAERAVEPQQPARGSAQYLLLAALVALLISVGSAFLVEHLDDTLKTPEDISKALGLITLGTIDRFANGEKGLVVVSQPQSGAAEAFRLLAANVRLAGGNRPGYTLLVTSPAPVEGKSVVAANLAVAMAGAGLRVVLIDADLRRPRQHELFGLSRGQGLTEALGQGSLNGNLQHTAVEGVKLLTSGVLPRDPMAAVSSGHLSRLFTELAGEADLVVIDSPPILVVADTTIVAAEADSVLLVIRAGRTKSQAARRAVEALRQARTHLTGVVLNAATVPNDGYYRYYGHEDKATSSRTHSKRTTRHQE